MFNTGHSYSEVAELKSCPDKNGVRIIKPGSRVKILGVGGKADKKDKVERIFRTPSGDIIVKTRKGSTAFYNIKWVEKS